MIEASLLISVIIFIIIFFNFFIYFNYKLDLARLSIIKMTEVWAVLLGPLIFLINYDFTKTNDCCSDSAVFSPDHRLGIYILITVCVITYFYSSYRTGIATPLIELFVNAVLVFAIVFNILICIQLNTEAFGAVIWIIGNIPIIMLLLMMLSHNQKKLHGVLIEFPKPDNTFTKLSWRILQAKSLMKFPLLLLISLPVTLLLSLILFVFGQQPDTLIRAFTDTYKHGFSQLDYLCDNVECGGHYLCSVAANGHKTIVKPERYGERNGHKIICNRQLLIANAFEELIQCCFPFAHTIIRKYYNKVGDVVHTYYAVFNNKFVADVVYILMKPLEYIFLITLYLLDKKPENRIAKQYLCKQDKQTLEALLSWDKSKPFVIS